MPRRTEHVTIEGDPSENRDAGKVFLITEMPAIQGEKWAAQLLALLVKSGVNIPDIPKDSGMAGIAALGASAGPLLSVLHDPSLDAWWDCVRYEHKPNLPPQKIIQGEGCQIEEISTITELRLAVLGLHVGFFSPVSPSTSASPSPIPTGSSPTRISRRPSAV
jgi:hypothetical protein